MAATKKLPGLRTTLSNFNISLGILDFTVDLIAPQSTESKKQESFKLACPKCAEPALLKQGYTCEENHGPFTVGQCDRAKELPDGTIIKVTQEEYEKAKECDIPPNVLSLTVYNTDEVSTWTIANGSTWVLRPAMANVKNLEKYSVFLKMSMEHPEWTFMGVCNIRKTEKLVSLAIGLNGQLLLTELAWPGEVKGFEDYSIPLKKGSGFDFIVSVANQMVEQDTFDPENFKKSSREKIAALIASKAGAEYVTSDTSEDEDDLDAAEASNLEAEMRRWAANAGIAV